MNFETLWDTHERKVVKKMSLKKNLQKTALFTMIGLIVLSVGGFAANQILQRDNVDYPFVSDPQLIGEWATVDFVKTPEDFNVDSRYWDEDLYLKNLAFMSDGNMWGVDTDSRGKYLPSGLTYTKDHILQCSDKTDSAYEIKTIGADQYLFMEWKSGDYTFRSEKPYYYVLKQISTQEMSFDTPESVRTDSVNITFENDPQALGKWKTVDFVDSPALFNPESISNQLGNYLLNVELLPDGAISIMVEDQATPSKGFFQWTNGKIYDSAAQCVESYEIKEINGKTYLFFPWINGDVVYRGTPASYYVLEKE